MSVAELDRMIERMRGLADLPRLAAELGAPFVQEEAKRSASAGTSPEGKAWDPRKRDGARALANAAEHVAAVALGTSIVIVLKGAEVFHQFNAYKRRIIPESGGAIPASIAAACVRGARAAFDRVMGAA